MKTDFPSDQPSPEKSGAATTCSAASLAAGPMMFTKPTGGNHIVIKGRVLVSCGIGWLKLEKVMGFVG